MTEVRCLLGGTVYRTPEDAFEAVKKTEAETGQRVSIRKHDQHYHLSSDGGRLRDIACHTKRYYRSMSAAKKKLKEMRRDGRRGLVIYQCWYADEETPHWHLGHPNGTSNHLRPGRIYG